MKDDENEVEPHVTPAINKSSGYIFTHSRFDVRRRHNPSEFIWVLK